MKNNQKEASAMLRKLVVLVLFGVLLVGGIAYSQPTVLSETQLEDTIGGWWKMCDKLDDCAQPCLYSSDLNKSYETKPVYHYSCSFSIYPASCSDFADLICGEVWTYLSRDCTGNGYHAPNAYFTEKGCGLYP